MPRRSIFAFFNSCALAAGLIAAFLGSPAATAQGAARSGTSAQSARYRKVTIQNTTPRVDIEGKVIDAHDGCLQFFAGRYYLYGTAYGKTAGYTINNRFRVYSSADMEHWTFEGELLKAPPDGVYYRPYVAYNQRTRKYVLWYNWYPKLWEGKVGVATSDSPTGPFTIVNTGVQLSQAKDHPGDGSLFVDDDNTGYFIYTTIDQHHSIRVERLTADFLGSTGEVGPVLAQGCESPTLFHRGSAYYAVFDHTCCFCTEGSGARILVSSNPLGEFHQIGNINTDSAGKPIIPAQQTYIARIPTSEGTAYLWMGDEWNSRKDGIKAHDIQFWGPPLKFNANGSIEPLQATASWTAEVQLGDSRHAAAKPYIWPQKVDPHPIRVDACLGTPLNERGEPVSSK